MSLSAGFLSFLEEENAATLVILAHFAVLIRPFESGTWFLNGWSTAVVEAATEALDVGDVQRISWPRQQVTDGRKE